MFGHVEIAKHRREQRRSGRGADRRPLTVTVEGAFEAVLPRTGAQNPAGAGVREAPMTPGAAGGMQR